MEPQRWARVQLLGQGGQGKVFKVFDRQIFDFQGDIYPSIKNSIAYLAASIQKEENQKEALQKFSDAIIQLIRLENPNNYGALKILHDPADATNFEFAKERLKREIDAMMKIKHPGILEILDADANSNWYVSKFYLKGPLLKHPERYKGNPKAALRAILPLIDAVAELHKKGFVHRDIKPDNIFIDENNNLILGDFGLIFFADAERTRVSETWENVGTRDWMPGWAQGMRIEEIKPNFDVFCLGKLLWWMIAGGGKLRLWYFKKPEFNLEERFPGSRHMNLINVLLSNCVVEEPENCARDATDFGHRARRVLTIIEGNGDLITGDPESLMLCKICMSGSYRMIIDRDYVDMKNFGIQPAGSRTFKIFSCSFCGNIQFFNFYSESEEPPAWPKRKRSSQ